MKNEGVINQWLSPKEISQLDGMPSSIQGVHKKAKREGWAKRPQVGKQGAGVEYQLPNHASDGCNSPSRSISLDSQLMKDDLLSTFSLLISKLSNDERERIARNLAIHGIGNLLNPNDPGEISEVLGVAVTDLKLARQLNGLPEKIRREILLGYGIEDRDVTVPGSSAHKPNKAS